MARKKKDDETLEMSRTDAGMESLMSNLIKSAEGAACRASDLADKIWGIPCDHISYRWLIDNNCYQMGRVFGVAGMKESCKSAFAMSLAKVWMDLEPRAMCIYIDTENKKSFSLYQAVVGEANTKKTMDYQSTSTEQWQSQVLNAIDQIKDHYSEKDMAPVLFIIDSLGGVDTRESETRVEKEGEFNPRNTGGMIKCKSHNEFFRYINKHLSMKPWSLVYINHLSDDPNSPIQGAKRKPGGTGQDYHAVLDLWFSVVKGTPSLKATRGFTEKILKVTTNKNSMGASKRNLEIPYRWSHDEHTGQINRCWFDWDAATAMLLTDEGPNSVKPRLKHILTVTVNSNKYSCKELGLVQVTDTELGEAIRNNVDMRERISDALGINRMKVFPNYVGSDREVYEKSAYARGASPIIEAPVEKEIEQETEQ